MHLLLREVGIMNAKQDLLAGYGVNSAADLSDHDLLHLVNRLVEMRRTKFEDTDKPLRKWRSNVMTLCNKYGVYVTNDNWKDVNRLLLNKRISGKLLYEMNLEELKVTCIKLRAILMKKEIIQFNEQSLAKLN